MTECAKYNVTVALHSGANLSLQPTMQYERLYGAERQTKMTPFAPILRYHD
jgi:hypothetical protein